ncbi:MAG: hypothetical protein CBB68_10155 [Rhodospirillaceae bacterium TMED8]|nr:4-hydroxybenzoyl-CoA thioesterase [Magnetovibrio sp.]OUT50214.1 MAG: hypothetical protein CBB68_10155 [Rhodospirillaceae bacterium TMED8]
MVNISPHGCFVRDYCEEIESDGIVCYANYLRYAERAKAEMIRAAGFANSKLMAKNCFAMGVRRCNTEYMCSGLLEDSLEVNIVLTRVGGATLSKIQSEKLKDENLVKMDFKFGCIKQDGRPSRLPEALRNELAQHTNKQ